MPRFAYRYLIAALLALLPLGFAHASTQEASAKVDSVAKQALSLISDASLDKDKKKASLQQLFSNSVDVPWVGRFVLGRYWKQATPDQQKRYLEEYDRFITANYAGRFAEYTGGSYSITKSTDDGNGEYTVGMQMKSPGNSQSVVVDYRLRKTGADYKIFDVIVEGVSLLATQRSEFAQVLGNGGIDALIEQMASHGSAQAAKN